MDYKWLDLQSRDLDRKDFNSFIQGWCLSSSSYPVSFVRPRYQTTRIKLKQRMKELTELTLDLLFKTFIDNENDKSSPPLMEMLSYLPNPLPQKCIELLWKAKLYRVLDEYYFRYDGGIPSTERDAFINRLLPIYLDMTEDERSSQHVVGSTISKYVREISTPEQFMCMFHFNNPWITKSLLKNERCPHAIMEACKDDPKTFPALLKNETVPAEIVTYILKKYKLPVSNYHISSLLADRSADIVIEIRDATLADRQNGLTEKQRQNWWEKLKTEEEL